MEFPASKPEKRSFSSQLALVYLEKQDLSGVSPSEFARKFFEVRDEIQKVVDEHPHL